MLAVVKVFTLQIVDKMSL